MSRPYNQRRETEIMQRKLDHLHLMLHVLLRRQESPTDPALSELTSKLKASADSLEAAVKANQPPPLS